MNTESPQTGPHAIQRATSVIIILHFILCVLPFLRERGPIIRSYPAREEGQVELLGRRLNDLARPDAAARAGTVSIQILHS